VHLYAEGNAVGVEGAEWPNGKAYAERQTEVVPRHLYAEGLAVGVAATPFPSAVRPQRYADGPDAESHLPAVGV
jgi:hypothetical protein